jgi:hypothetical protein
MLNRFSRHRVNPQSYVGATQPYQNINLDETRVAHPIKRFRGGIRMAPNIYGCVPIPNHFG